MYLLTRRNFIKQILLLLPYIFLPKKIKASINKGELEQKILMNLPAYSLKLMNFVDGSLEEIYHFPIGIGRGSFGRRETPTGDGFIYEKRKNAIN